MCTVARPRFGEQHDFECRLNVVLFPHRNLLVNLGLFAAGVWVARNLSDFDLMAPQPVT